MANPFTPTTNFGTNMVAIAAPQTTWGTEAQTSAIIQKFLPIRSATLRQEKTNVEITTLKGTGAPEKSQLRQLSVSGDIGFNFTEINMGPWIRAALYDTASTTTAVADGVIQAAAAYTAGTAITITDAKQPYKLLTAPVTAGQIEVTIAGGVGAGKITIVGNDQNEDDITEVINFQSSAVNGAHVSTKFFREITSLIIADVTTPGTAAIKVLPKRNKHVSQMTEAVPQGYTFELQKGTGTPVTYESAINTSSTISLEELVSFNTTWTGRRADPRKAIGGGATPTSTSGFTAITGEIAVDTGIEFAINGTVYPVATLSLSINQNVAPPPTQFAKTRYLPRPSRSGNREIVLTGEIDYSKALDFDTPALFNTTQEDVEMRVNILPSEGGHTSYTWKMPKGVIRQFPDPPVDGGGPITQTLEIAAFAEGSDVDLECIAITSESSSDF